MDVLKNAAALLFGLPFVTFALLWLGFHYWFAERKKALQLAMDVTTVLLIASVSVMYRISFGSAMGFWFIVLFFAVLAGVIGNAQNRLKGKVDVRRMARAVWRIGFLVLSVCYIVLLFIGISLKYFET